MYKYICVHTIAHSCKDRIHFAGLKDDEEKVIVGGGSLFAVARARVSILAIRCFHPIQLHNELVKENDALFKSEVRPIEWQSNIGRCVYFISSYPNLIPCHRPPAVPLSVFARLLKGN